MKKLFRLLCRLVVLACIAAVILVTLPPLARKADQLLYPRKYSQQVEQWAAEYGLDPLLVYAFIRTESGQHPFRLLLPSSLHGTVRRRCGHGRSRLPQRVGDGG